MTTTTLPQSDPAPPSGGRARLTARLLARADRAAGRDRERLLDQVIVLNLRVARAVARRYAKRGVPLEDLEQVAFEGLTKAVHRFDAGRRRDLLNFATPTIRGEIQRYFRDHAWTVRPSRQVQDDQWRINRTIDDLTAELGRSPRDDEVRAALDLDREDFDKAVGAFGCMHPASLDQPIETQPGSSSLTLADTVASDRRTDRPAMIRGMLAPVLRRLSRRDREVLYLRFFEDRTQAEIGRHFGVAQAQVSRWLSRILGDVRRALAGRGPLAAA